MGKGVLVAVVLVAGGLCYLSYRGVTVQSARYWVEAQLGIGNQKIDPGSIPHPGYAPIVVPRR